MTHSNFLEEKFTFL